MYVEFTKYSGETFTYDTDLSVEDIATLWNITQDVSQIERRLNAIQDFAEAIGRRFERVEIEAQFFT